MTNVETAEVLSLSDIDLLGDLSIPDELIAAEEETSVAVTEDAVGVIPSSFTLESGDALDDSSAYADHHTQAGNWSAGADATLDDGEVEIDPDAFDKVKAAFEDAPVRAYAFAIAGEIDSRIPYEEARLKAAGKVHEPIVKKLNGARAKFVSDRAARVMMACAIDAAFVNRSVSGEARYNIYAVEKLADLVAGLSGGVVKNAVNRACAISMFRCAKAGIAWDLDMAKAATSDKIAVPVPGARSLMVRHDVGASTAPTQAGSTMQALTTLGVVSRAGGTVKNPVYSLNENAPVTQALKTILGVAA